MNWAPRTKADWRAKAKKNHMCTACLHYQTATFKACPRCGEDGMRVFFPSMAELSRASSLIRMLVAGEISDLKFHPCFDLMVEGQKVAVYEADSMYRKDGKQVVEDVKPEGDFMEDVAKIKIRLFDVLHAKHGLSVKIVR